jgi:hypothetical protein
MTVPVATAAPEGAAVAGMDETGCQTVACCATLGMRSVAKLVRM